MSGKITRVLDAGARGHVGFRILEGNRTRKYRLDQPLCSYFRQLGRHFFTKKIVGDVLHLPFPLARYSSARVPPCRTSGSEARNAFQPVARHSARHPKIHEMDVGMFRCPNDAGSSVEEPAQEVSSIGQRRKCTTPIHHSLVREDLDARRFQPKPRVNLTSAQNRSSALSRAGDPARPLPWLVSSR